MLTLLLRGIIIYLIVFFIFRVMGKRQLGQLQPFEFVITLIIADLATIPMSEINIPIVHGIVPLVTIAILHFLISLLSRKSLKLRKLFNGSPKIVINPNGVDYEQLKKLNMDFDDLYESLRSMNYFSLDQIQYAIVETNGKISVLPTVENTPVVASDFDFDKEKATLPLMIVCDGKKVEKNVEITKIDDKFLTDSLKSAGIKRLKDVLIATIDNAGKMYIQARNEKYKTIQTNFKGGNNW